jgi:hypothetical protein
LLRWKITCDMSGFNCFASMKVNALPMCVVLLWENLLFWSCLLPGREDVCAALLLMLDTFC